jgi:UDP-GlcNAc3NAcA epimerase
LKVLSIIGARPQFIKAAPLSRALRQKHTEILVHTGQHYDENMSQVFFDDLGIPLPDHNLGVGSGPHGAQTGAMLAAIEPLLIDEAPDWTLVYGDTNSTLAGALAAAKLHIPLAHVEAGLRSFNRRMPEEINRLLSDHVSDLLLCPSQAAVDNLAAEGITRGVHYVGDVMADALEYASGRASDSPILGRLGLHEGGYLLATLHRAENTGDPRRLESIIAAFAQVQEPLIFPIHPRTRNALTLLGYAGLEIRNSKFEFSRGSSSSKNPVFIFPLGYLDMVALMRSARLILTDSGGMQKEAYWLGVPCLTLRDETEWVETVTAGWNRLVGAHTQAILQAVQDFNPPQSHPPLYGGPGAAQRIVSLLEDHNRTG